jgi:hypothetical protein
LQYATSLELDDPATLASRLYCFNACPASPMARQRWPGVESVAAFLELERYDSASHLAVHTSGSWQGWSVRGARRRRSEPRFKLYVSPRAEWVVEVLREVVPRLAEFRALECKVGRDLHGLLRPDKLMVYFRTLAALRSAARRWERALAGVPAQGVPFSADLGAHGLLSWGMDPPDLRRGAARRGPPLSWRTWVTRRLADALVAAKRSPVARAAPVQFAVDRVGLDGVDTRRWAPSSRLRRTSVFG